jgi:hypothetical protein
VRTQAIDRAMQIGMVEVGGLKVDAGKTVHLDIEEGGALVRLCHGEGTKRTYMTYRTYSEGGRLESECV